jgi:hypothetical protein
MKPILSNLNPKRRVLGEPAPIFPRERTSLKLILFGEGVKEKALPEI